MKKKSHRGKKHLKEHLLREHPLATYSVALILAFGVFWAFLYRLDYTVPDADVKYGITFSKPHAESLGLDYQDVLTAALDELGIRRFRLSAYWDEIEPVDDRFDFTALDWQIKQIAKRGGTVILGVGQRLPRWPECHTPAWAEEMDRGPQQQKILQMIPVVVSRYEREPAIIRWQVENEPLLPFFGRCAAPDEAFLKKEIALVRRMDDTRPIMTTASGELGDWDRTGRLVNVLGVSLYRTIWKPLLGYFDYPLPPAFYKLRAEATKKTTTKIVLSELQAEPWLPGEPLEVPLEEHFRSMNPAIFDKTLRYARMAGFDEIYLWGLEWWYWLKTEHNDPGMWNVVSPLWAAQKL